MNIAVLETHTDCSGFQQLAMFHSTVSKCQDRDITLDFSQCKFFDANMVAPLAALIELAKARSKTFTVQNLQKKVRNALRRNYFLEQFGHGRLDDKLKLAIPYEKFAVIEHHKFWNYLQNVMSKDGMPHMTPNLTYEFQKSLFELFSNSRNHAKTELGVFACGQLFSTEDTLRLTISDAGIGMLASIREKEKEITDEKAAIVWALETGNTANIGKKPGGMGLKLIKEFVDYNKGELLIVSGRGFYQYNKGRQTTELFSTGLPGTTVSLKIDTTDQNLYSLNSESHP